MIFYQLAHLAAPTNGEMFVTLNVAITFLYTILACAAANVAFKGITILPEMAFKWLGGISIADRSEPALPAGGPNPNLSPGGLPNLSMSPSLLAQSSANNSNLVTRSAGGKAAQNLKLALFPQYRDSDKYTAPSTTEGLPPGAVQRVESTANTKAPDGNMGPPSNAASVRIVHARYLEKAEKAGANGKPKSENLAHVGKKTGAGEGAKEGGAGSSSGPGPDSGPVPLDRER
jgi:hypothetical protein